MASLKPYDHDHENEVQLFAKANFRNRSVRFGIKTDDRRRHVYVIGKSGMGKTTLLENMILSDIHAGHGCCYIDPHGDTAQNILDYIPSNRINDVVYFNPADTAFPIGFNILEAVDPEKKHLVAAGLMAVFKKIWPDVWSARMEYILVNTILALLDVPGATMLGINRLYVDEEYRKRVVSLIQDPVVKTFWVKEFAAFSEKYRTEAVAPVQNKVGQFMSASIIRNIVAQVKSTIDMRDIMDNRKILIVNLSKGLIGEENMHLLGGMIITRLQLAAMERVDLPESERQDFYMYVDEFQNFANESFATILSEARKYRLCLIMAHQYIEQIDEKVRSAIFGNVGTMISFRVGGPDAQELEKEFAPYFTPEDLIGLTKYDVYLRLLIDGVASTPFSATTLPPIAEKTNSTDKVIKVSRERYAVPRKNIEENVIKWSGFGSGEAGNDLTENLSEKEPSLKVSESSAVKTEEPPNKKNPPFFVGDDDKLEEKVKELQASSPYVGETAKPADGGGFGQKKKKDVKHEVPCSVCGAIQKLTFDPDWSKPWFCKDHLELRNTPMARKLPSIAQLTGREVPNKKSDGPKDFGRSDKRNNMSNEPKRPSINELKPIEIAGGSTQGVSLASLKSQDNKNDRPRSQSSRQSPPLGSKGKPRITVSKGEDNAADELLCAVAPQKKDGPSESNRPTSSFTSPVVGRELRSGGRPTGASDSRDRSKDSKDRLKKDNKPRITVSKGEDNAADELLCAVAPQKKDGPSEPKRLTPPLTSPVVVREISAPSKRRQIQDKPKVSTPKPAPGREGKPLKSSPSAPKTPTVEIKSPNPPKPVVPQKESAPESAPLTSPVVEREVDPPADKPKIVPPSPAPPASQPEPRSSGEKKTDDKSGNSPSDASARQQPTNDDVPSVGGYDDTTRPGDSWKPGQVIKF